MNCNHGDLCRVVSDGPFQDKLIVVTDMVNFGYGPEWHYEGPDFICTAGFQHTFFDRVLRPIRDQPGNESWFTAAPKSLPATTKGDTITERGELA